MTPYASVGWFGGNVETPKTVSCPSNVSSMGYRISSSVRLAIHCSCAQAGTWCAALTVRRIILKRILRSLIEPQGLGYLLSVGWWWFRCCLPLLLTVTITLPVSFAFVIQTSAADRWPVQRQYPLRFFFHFLIVLHWTRSIRRWREKVVWLSSASRDFSRQISNENDRHSSEFLEIFSPNEMNRMTNEFIGIPTVEQRVMHCQMDFWMIDHRLEDLISSYNLLIIHQLCDSECDQNGIELTHWMAFGSFKWVEWESMRRVKRETRNTTTNSHGTLHIDRFLIMMKPFQCVH